MPLNGFLVSDMYKCVGLYQMHQLLVHADGDADVMVHLCRQITMRLPSFAENCISMT